MKKENQKARCSRDHSLLPTDLVLLSMGSSVE